MSREQAVRAVIEGIAESFSKLDVDRWLSFFNPQHTFVLHDSVGNVWCDLHAGGNVGRLESRDGRAAR